MSDTSRCLKQVFRDAAPPQVLHFMVTPKRARKKSPNMAILKVSETDSANPPITVTQSENSTITETTLSPVSFQTVVKSVLKFKKQNGGYRIKPLDLILFKGEDAIGKMIQNIEEKWVSHHARKPDGTLWTHVGVIVDKTILPLECLEEDKLYIYESIFTGTVLGYTYSRVFPVDHPFLNGKINHSGPQLRPFVTSCLETSADIAIAPLKIKEREKLYSRGLQTLQQIMLSHYNEYYHYGYPMSVIPQFAAASDGLYNFIHNAKSATKK